MEGLKLSTTLLLLLSYGAMSAFGLQVQSLNTTSDEARSSKCKPTCLILAFFIDIKIQSCAT